MSNDDFNPELFDTFLPWADIPETDFVPDMESVLKWTNIIPKQDSNGKVFFNAVLKIHEPEAYRGMPIFQRLFVSSEEKPQGVDPAESDARTLQQMRIAANIPAQVDQFKKLQAFLKSNEPYIGGTVIKYFDKFYSKDANKVSNWWKPGSRKPEVLTNAKPAAGGGGKSKAAPAPPTMPKAPIPQPPKAPQAPPFKPEAFKPGDGSDEEKKGFGVTCPTCRESVSPANLAEHIKTCRPGKPAKVEEPDPEPQDVTETDIIAEDHGTEEE